jgi:hypothetical protein
MTPKASNVDNPLQAQRSSGLINAEGIAYL